jgi:hypothetical protein
LENLAPKNVRLRASRSRFVPTTLWLRPRAWASMMLDTCFWTFQISVPSKPSLAHLKPVADLIPLAQASREKANNGAR